MLLRQVDKKLGLIAGLDKAIKDPRNPNLITHKQKDLLKQRNFALALGYEDLNNHDTLTRIFHTGSSRGAANSDVDKEGDGLRRRLYVSYCPRSNSKLTQYPSGVRKPQQNQCEICGLG